MSELEKLIRSGEALLERIEKLLPAASRPVDWGASIAFRWRKSPRGGYIQPVANVHRIRLSDLHGVYNQKARIEKNTRQFVESSTANNGQQTGQRGNRKSTLS